MLWRPFVRRFRGHPLVIFGQGLSLLGLLAIVAGQLLAMAGRIRPLHGLMGHRVVGIVFCHLNVIGAFFLKAFCFLAIISGQLLVILGSFRVADERVKLILGEGIFLLRL